MTHATSDGTRARRPIGKGLLSEPLDDLSAVRLLGSRCATCGEVSLGSRSFCLNCGRDTVSIIPLSNHGVLWTYTVVRHRPPGGYRGPEPFVPFGLGLVELPDGLRVLSPIRCAVDRLTIGLALRFRADLRSGDDGAVVTFSFEAADGQAASHV